MNLPRPLRRPEEMKPWVQVLLVVVSARHVTAGLICVFLAEAFEGGTYDAFKAAAPMPAYGLLFIFAGLTAAAGALTRREGIARKALLASVFSTGIIGGGYLSSLMDGEVPAIIGLSFALALIAKDLIIVRSVLRSPLDPLVREAARRGR